MTGLERALERVARDLDAIGVGWAVVGGLAVSARAEPRFTRDVDVVIAVADDRAAEAVTRSLAGRGYRVFAHLEQAETARLATVRMALPGVGRGVGEVVVDALFASSGIEPEVVAAADRIEIVAGLSLPIARVGHLIALKLLARDDRHRPQDADDLRRLVAVADQAEVDRAREAVRLISRRGFARGRDLVGALETLVS